VKNPIHLDLRCDAARAELDRLPELGANLVAEYGDHLPLRDSEGNELRLSWRIEAESVGGLSEPYPAYRNVHSVHLLEV
jgi:hypothetical protein